MFPIAKNLHIPADALHADARYALGLSDLAKEQAGQPTQRRNPVFLENGTIAVTS